MLTIAKLHSHPVPEEQVRVTEKVRLERDSNREQQMCLH